MDVFSYSLKLARCVKVQCKRVIKYHLSTKAMKPVPQKLQLVGMKTALILEDGEFYYEEMNKKFGPATK